MAVSKPAVELLRRLDAVTIPSINVADYIESANAAAEQALKQDSLAIITTADALAAPVLSMAGGVKQLRADQSEPIRESVTVDLQGDALQHVVAASLYTSQAQQPASVAPSSNTSRPDLQGSVTPSPSLCTTKTDDSGPSMVVQGRVYALQDIGDELLEQMTADEYTQYYELMQSQG